MPTYINRHTVSQSVYDIKQKKYITIEPNQSIAVEQLLVGNNWEKVYDTPYVSLAISSSTHNIAEAGMYIYPIDVINTKRIFVAASMGCTIHANVKEAPGIILVANTKFEISTDREIENIVVYTEGPGILHITEMEE
jgi:hypothetical protein